MKLLNNGNINFYNMQYIGASIFSLGGVGAAIILIPILVSLGIPVEYCENLLDYFIIR